MLSYFYILTVTEKSCCFSTFHCTVHNPIWAAYFGVNQPTLVWRWWVFFCSTEFAFIKYLKFPLKSWNTTSWCDVLQRTLHAYLRVVFQSFIIQKSFYKYFNQPCFIFIFFCKETSTFRFSFYTQLCVWLFILLYLNVHMCCATIAVLMFVKKKKVDIIKHICSYSVKKWVCNCLPVCLHHIQCNLLYIKQ